MADANGQPTLEEIRAERERRARSTRNQAAAAGQPISVEAIRAERARRASQRQPPPRGDNLAHQYATGVAEGTAGTVAAVGDAPGLLEGATGWVAERLGMDGDRTRAGVRGLTTLAGSLYSPVSPVDSSLTPHPTSEQLNRAIESIPGVEYAPEPTTLEGSTARTLGQFTPGAVFPGSTAARVARVVVPAATSETAGQVAREVAPEYEPAARVLGGLAGGLATEATIVPAAQRLGTRRYTENQRAIANQALEDDIAPMTQGERLGNLEEMALEQRLRHGIGNADQAQREMAVFDVGRAERVRDRVLTGVGERGGRAVAVEGEPIPGDLESAGNDLMNSLRRQRREMLDQAGQQYETTYSQLRAEPVARTGNISVIDDMRMTLDAPDVLVPFESLPANSRNLLGQLQRQLDAGEPITQAHLENIRRRMNTDMASAMRQGGLDEYDMRAALAAFDDWRANTIFERPIRALREDGVAPDQVERLMEAVRRGTRQRNIAAAVDPELAALERTSTGRRSRAALRVFRNRVAMARNLEEARAMYHEARNLFGRQARQRLSTDYDEHTGRQDIGGAQIERLLEAERTGERVMRQLFGNFRGSLPESSLATLQKIRRLGTQRISYNERNAASGVRTPGRLAQGTESDPTVLDERLVRSRRFLADSPNARWSQQSIEGRTGVQLPTDELQAARRGYLRVLVEEMDDYLTRAQHGDPGKAGLAPLRTMASKFERALTGEGRRVTELMFTPDEIAQLERVRTYLNRVNPPAGTHPVSSPAAIQAAWDQVKGLLGKIPVLGELATEIVVRGRATRQAQQAVRPVGRVRPMRQPRATAPNPLVPPATAIEGAQHSRRLGERPIEDYSAEELEAIAAGAN